MADLLLNEMSIILNCVLLMLCPPFPTVTTVCVCVCVCVWASVSTCSNPKRCIAAFKIQVLNENNIQSFVLGWRASDVGRCVILPFVDSFLITAVNSSTVAMGVSPLKLNNNRTVPSSQWAMLAGDVSIINLLTVCRHCIY